MLERRIYDAVLFSFFFLIGEISGTTYPLAQNVTWSSLNFKTILMWGPTPTNYSYTVEYSVVGGNQERNPHCIRTMTTECDLTNSLDKIKDTYSAVVVSEPLPGMSSDLPELPYTKAERFCPYKDSTIGKPDFTIDVSKDKRKITLNITDPTSAIYADNKFLTMRDIFMSDLKYKVTYGKAQTSGKRFKDTETSQIVLDVDKGASYCFTVQAYIISRDPGKQLGESSQVKCSPAGDRPFYEEYSIGAIVGIIFVIIGLVCAIILAVVCCRRRKRARNYGKDDPL